jgi:pimeloyl-ACP methyl ester carboxylesterase
MDSNGYREHRVARGPYRLHAREYQGQEPAIVLLHGFPDDLHLYDRLVPELAPRRVVVFDFLGWGASDKPSGYPYTAGNQTGDLDAVIEQLQLTSAVLVAHDASGPPAIDWALEHPDRVAALVLLNTYYSRMPGLRPPEAIRLFSTPMVRSVARPISRLFGDLLFRGMYRWQVGRFFRDPEVREEFLPLLYRQFAANPSTHEAFFGLTRTCGPPWPPGRRRSRGCGGSPPGPDRLRRRRPVPQCRGGTALPRAVPDLGAVPAGRRPPLRADGRATAGRPAHPRDPGALIPATFHTAGVSSRTSRARLAR